MAITQQDIISEIPTIIKQDSFDILMSLAALTAIGWGSHCDLYIKIQNLIALSIDAKQSKFIFNSELLTTTKVNCNRCFDKGVITPLEVLLSNELSNVNHDIPCPDCSDNTMAEQ